MIAAAPSSAPSRARPDAVLFVLLAGQFMANLDTAIVNLAVPSIGATLHASGAELQLTAGAYVLASAMFLVTAARLGAIAGRRSVFLAGLAIFTAASLACGLATTAGALIAGRAIQGAGAALMVAQVLSGIHLRTAGAARARALGAYTLTLSGSAVAGQILGGALVTANIGGSAWRPIFLINVPLGIALFAAATCRLPRDQGAQSRARLDAGGVALFAATMLLAVIPLTLGRETGWPAWTWIALGACAAGASIFVARERRLSATNGAPLVDTRLFAVRGVAPVLIASALTRITYFSLLFVIALYLQNGRGYRALDAGLMLVAWVAAYGVAGPVYSRLAARNTRCSAILGCLGMAGAYVGLAATASSTTPLIAACLGVGGFGFGIASTALVVHLTSIVPPSLSADVSGVMSTLVPLTGAVGVATFGSLYLAVAVGKGAGGASHGFALTCILFAACAAVAALAVGCSAGSRQVPASLSRS